jgi:DNA invertase Pin-like site-specific DNA recombinase
MTKITADHLARAAFVYIRQSTADQLVHNQESRRRQYGLADRAKQLGWATVEIVDDDLGRSGGGVTRPGFERLLAAICQGRVGAVFAIEVSRLARNGRDWHTLIEFCGLVATVIVDEDGIYDPRHSNDRLLLGMKGAMSELELSLFRQRSQEALRQKARRGALFLGVAAGYVKTGRDRIEKDPDQRVQDALGIVFAKFAELQSVRQVHAWLREEGIALPTACHSAAEGRSVVWRAPLYNTVHNILTNPVYAGAYAFGRTTSKVSVEEGRKRVRRGVRRSLAEWDVLLKDQHDGYISWAEFERNQRVIANNATGKGSAIARGAARHGELLLAGLLRCGHCGRKMYVAYGGKAGRYHCEGALVNHGTERCISFGGLRADLAVGAEVLRILKPLGVDAAVRALDAQAGETSAAKRQLELALQRARFEAAHARRQYDAVDPTNRLVAGELERRWNEALQVVHRIESEIAAVEARKPAPLGEEERQQLMQLGADLARLVVPCGDIGDAQEDRACGFERNRSARRSRAYRDDPALAGRRPYCAEAEEERSRQAPLDDTRGYTVAGPRVGAADARPANRTAPQSRRQADGAWQRLDPGAGVLVPQPPWHRCPSCKRVGGTGRDHA